MNKQWRVRGGSLREHIERYRDEHGDGTTIGNVLSLNVLDDGSGPRGFCRIRVIKLRMRTVSRCYLLLLVPPAWCCYLPALRYSLNVREFSVWRFPSCSGDAAGLITLAYVVRRCTRFRGERACADPS
jgi:hypothetical protein